MNGLVSAAVAVAEIVAFVDQDDSIAAKIGCSGETLRKWVRQAERDLGQRAGLTTSERERLKELEAEGRLLGRITIDDMVDVLEEDAEHSALAAAGLDQASDLFEPVGRSVRSRAIWLGVNLFNALISAWIIGRFGGAIEAMVALAVLMPVVASMGGVAGNQTLTLVTRGLATEQVSRRNTGALMRRELAVASLNGLFWAMIVGAVVLVWFDIPALAAVFAVAVFINLVNGTLSGAMIPLLLQRLGLDPALAGGVVLTMLTDGIGFGVFLALATLFLL